MSHHAAPTIERIETTVFRLPMRGALQWGKSSRMAELRHVLVRVCLSDGSEGYAEAPPRPTIYGETPATICSVIAEEFAPRVLGMPVANDVDADAGPLSACLLRIQDRLHEVKNNFAARGAIDMALHAALAERRGITLAQHLGASVAGIRVSYILGIGDRDTVMHEAARVAEQGVRVLKVKVGRNWQEDSAHILELRDTLGPEVALYADANETMQAETASARLAELAELGLLYCEEPLPVEQMRERTRLCLPVSICPSSPTTVPFRGVTWRGSWRATRSTYSISRPRAYRLHGVASDACGCAGRRQGLHGRLASQCRPGDGARRCICGAARRGTPLGTELSTQARSRHHRFGRFPSWTASSVSKTSTPFAWMRRCLAWGCRQPVGS